MVPGGFDPRNEDRAKGGPPAEVSFGALGFWALGFQDVGFWKKDKSDGLDQQEVSKPNMYTTADTRVFDDSDSSPEDAIEVQSVASHDVRAREFCAVLPGAPQENVTSAKD